MTRRHVAGATITVVGLGLAAVQTLHAAEQTSSPLALLFEAGPFVLLALALASAGVWLARAPEMERDADRVLAWGAGGLTLFLAVTASILFGPNASLARGAYVALDLATVGAVAGVIVGLYDAKRRDNRREHAGQRDRGRTFASRAADVDHYGRALDQCGDLDDVAALLVQAVGTILDLDEAAVLERRDDRFRVVESTIVDADPADLAALADRTGSATRATVETYREDLPPSIAARTDTAIGLLVTDTVGPSVVILALGDGRSIADETVQLFELLVAHAGTALDGIYASDGR